jgi:phage antirepressor YoqD-like protein
MEFTLQDLDVAMYGNYPYTTDYVAKYINHPKITGRNTLRNFLRDEGLMKDNYPTYPSIMNGYIKLVTLQYHDGRLYDKVMISPAGLEYIGKLIEEKLGPVKPVTVKLSATQTT